MERKAKKFRLAPKAGIDLFCFQTRSGCSFFEILEEHNPKDIAVLQLSQNINLQELAQRAIDFYEHSTDELQEFETIPPIPPPTSLEPSSIPSNPSIPLSSTSLPTRSLKRLAPCDESPCTEPTQSRKHRQRAKRRKTKVAQDGHTRGEGYSFTKLVLPSVAFETCFESKDLPIAEGGYIGTKGSYYGAKVKRDIEELQKKGFTYVPWKGRYVHSFLPST